MKGISSGAQSIFCHCTLFQQEKKQSLEHLKLSIISAHFLQSIIWVWGSEGKRRQLTLQMTHSTIDRYKMFLSIFLAKNDSSLQTPFCEMLQRLLCLELVVVSLGWCRLVA